MCGITGFFNYGGSAAPDETLLRRMVATQAHRGPDDVGFHVEPGVGLGFSRLSIVDLSGGHQPLSNHDQSLWLIFNGELYNHLELRGPLERAGHRYKTRSDAETVLHAYAEWGVDCLERFQGMFAFVIYDRAKRRVFAARDRMGIKPFNYCDLGNEIVFGSEIKSLLPHPRVPREADPEAAALFLTYRYLPSPHTLFRGIHKLPPGHFLIADAGGVQIRRWWDVPLDAHAGANGLADGKGSCEDAARELRDLMEQSVRARLMSDVPFGALLSGGLDSSIIVTLMARMHDAPVKTFSVGFAGSTGNESELPFARTVANRLGTDHHELTMEEADLPGYITPLIWHMDEPLVEPAAIPVYLISRLARETVTVVLTGEGADELYAGYPKYGRDHWAHAYARVPRFLREQVVRRGLETIPRPLRRLRVAERSLSIPEDDARFASWFAGFAGAGRRAILDPALLARLDDPSGSAPTAGWLRGVPAGADGLTRMLYADVKTWLADDLLMKMDRMSMATSIEARVPFLDHRVVNHAFSIPSAWKVRDGVGKWILREAFGPELPPEVLQRPKAGFPVPIDQWFRTRLKGFLRETLLSDRLAARGVLNPAEVRRTVEDHIAGRRDNRRELWTLLNLELWYQLYIDAPAPPEEQPAVANFSGV